MNSGIQMREQKIVAKTVVFTCAAINYLPKVRKLFASIREHHPEFELVLLWQMNCLHICSYKNR